MEGWLYDGRSPNPASAKQLYRLWAQLEPWQREVFDALRANPPGVEGEGLASAGGLRVIVAVLRMALAPAPTLGQRLTDITINRSGVPTDRGQFLELIKGAGLAAACAPLEAIERMTHHGTRPVDAKLVTAHETIADALADWHYMLPSDAIVGLVARHADLLDNLLDRPMPEAHRRRLEVITVGTHVHAAIEAFCIGDRRAARGSFATARGLADEADDDTLRAQAVALSVVLHSPIEAGARGGDSRRAVELMRRAVHHARHADPATCAYSHRWLGLELAAAGDEEGFLTSFEAGDRLPAQDDPPGGHGFLARYFTERPGGVSRTRGIGLVRIGRAEEALEALEIGLAAATPRALVITLVDVAAAHVLLGQVEQACEELQRALDLIPESGYRVGIERILGVRAQFDPRWAGLDCVRQLDERLAVA